MYFPGINLRDAFGDLTPVLMEKTDKYELKMGPQQNKKLLYIKRNHSRVLRNN